MGTESFRLFLLLIIIFFYSILANQQRYNDYSPNASQQRLTLSGLLTCSNQKNSSMDVALNQIKSSSPFIRANFELNIKQVKCDVGTDVKTFFDMLNQSSRLSVLFTDVCQNVLSQISETATYFRLPVISFTDSDLSLLAKDRYPYFHHIVPSDHAHNLVRKKLLQYFNWTRFGLIYQHGSKYTLVANDFSNLTAIDKSQFEINITRGLAYLDGVERHQENELLMKNILKDFKDRDVRIIIANFNQTIASHMFCQAAHKSVYGSRYQWIILGYPSLLPWWHESTNCSLQELVRAINGTLQTRVPRLSLSIDENQPNYVTQYVNIARIDENYFDAYAYDAIWTLAHIYKLHSNDDPMNAESFRNAIDKVDFIGATGRVRYSNGGRIGEVAVEQFVACRKMPNGSCTIPCYAEEDDCDLIVVKVLLAKHLEAKDNLPNLYKINTIMWHGNGPPRDRTNQTSQFQHVHLSVFISMSIFSGIGLLISCSFFAFNIHFRLHRYIRMSSPLLNNIILCGCMLAYISIILMGINSSLFIKESVKELIMNIICPIRVWILCISFTLAFGSMFSKTWRVHSIFTNINMTKRGIHDSRLLVIVGLLLFIDLIFLILWQIIDPIHRKLIYDVAHRVENNQDIEIIPFREECKSQNMSIWFVVLVLYKGLLMFYGSFLSWKTRHVTIPALNDSRYIGLSVYIVFICCTLGSLVIFIPSEQIQFSYFLRSFFIAICTTATVCLVFVPKIIEVYRDPYSKKKQPRITNRFHENKFSSIPITNQHLNLLVIDNQELKFILSMQEQTLNRLLEQFNNCQVGNEKTIDVEPFELERLIVQDEDEDVDDDDDDDDEDVETNSSFMRNYNLSQPGRVARAVSLCLFNRIQRDQITWMDTGGISRYSIPSHDDHYHSPMLIPTDVFQPTSHFSTDPDPTTKLSEINEDNESSSRNVEHSYNDIEFLDKNCLDQMIETDLVSSSNP